MNEPHYLDVRQLRCPLPILRAKKALAALDSGCLLVVEATDAGAPDDFAAFCRHTGHELVSREDLPDGVFRITLKHK